MTELVLKGNNTPVFNKYLLKHGFRIKRNQSGMHGFDLAGNTNDFIDVVVQQIIDGFDPIAADKEQRIIEIDEVAKKQEWRPHASDIMRVIDAREFNADGRPATPAAGKYLWLIDAATAKGRTLGAMADIILTKEEAVRLREKKRLDDKAAINA